LRIVKHIIDRLSKRSGDWLKKFFLILIHYNLCTDVDIEEEDILIDDQLAMGGSKKKKPLISWMLRQVKDYRLGKEYKQAHIIQTGLTASGETTGYQTTYLLPNITRDSGGYNSRVGFKAIQKRID